ncbi:MAG: tRNA (adenosine(37)-N6)-dimethylallyltransferase MiaA [Treponema sp.]|jgi:tRNA dimethylallyltransferase|nr:tRNA (adenosine(37)-N6)-dimethylallyltransferase MiaA [Treponema sp.]
MSAIPVLLLFGPTASGKTGLLEQLFAGPGAEFPAEIISADSMQVYRGMDIGTAKPSRELRERLPHHLIDIRDPREQFNAGEFVRLADAAALAVYQRGALPVVSGGTGFYLSNFVQGLPEAPPPDPAIRRALREELERRGGGALHAELFQWDPRSAERIHPHDTYRLLRALEVYRLSGRPLSSFARAGSAGMASRPGYRFLLLGLERPREAVYRRINERCACMFREGLPAEARKLRDAGYGPDDPGMRAIGYREFFIPPGTGPPDLAALEALVARNSRRYAKRQLTCFASLPKVRWIDAEADPLGAVRRELRQFIEAKE